VFLFLSSVAAGYAQIPATLRAAGGFFCAVATIGAIQQMHVQATKEAKEFPSEFVNPQIQALFITEVLAVFGFFGFVFFPELTEPLWSWVNKIGFPT